mgnify:CR=1 FL=1
MRVGTLIRHRTQDKEIRLVSSFALPVPKNFRANSFAICLVTFFISENPQLLLGALIIGLLSAFLRRATGIGKFLAAMNGAVF